MEMSPQNYGVVSGIFFLLVSLAHLYRVVAGIPIQVDAIMIPMWVSWIATIVPAVLAFWGFRVARQK
jgi:hypothetical protein